MKDKEKFKLTTAKLDKIILLLEELKSFIVSNTNNINTNTNTIPVTDEPTFIPPAIKPIIPKSKKEKEKEKEKENKNVI